MEKLKKFLSRFRLVYRRSSTLTKYIVICALLVSTVTMISLGISLGRAEDRAAALREEAAALQQENAQLQEDVESLGTVEGIKKIAYRLLGLIDPDAVIFEPEE